MRIVAGDHRGRLLVAPKGHSTRPTADQARQALFNVLEHAAWSPGLKGLRVLDLFAGSGALGLEALSRGAQFCLFVDNDAAAAHAIHSNLDTLGLGARSRLDRRDAARLEVRADTDGPAFDLAFLDPPYVRGLCEPALERLTTGEWLLPGALAIVERGVEEPAPLAGGYEVMDNRRWGAARVWFLRTAGASPTAK